MSTLLCCSIFGRVGIRCGCIRAALWSTGWTLGYSPSRGVLKATMFSTLLLRRRLAIELLYDDRISFSGTGGAADPRSCLRAARRLRYQNRKRKYKLTRMANGIMASPSFIAFDIPWVVAGSIFSVASDTELVVAASGTTVGTAGCTVSWTSRTGVGCASASSCVGVESISAPRMLRRLHRSVGLMIVKVRPHNVTSVSS